MIARSSFARESRRRVFAACHFFVGLDSSWFEGPFGGDSFVNRDVVTVVIVCIVLPSPKENLVPPAILTFCFFLQELGGHSIRNIRVSGIVVFMFRCGFALNTCDELILVFWGDCDCDVALELGIFVDWSSYFKRSWGNECLTAKRRLSKMGVVMWRHECDKCLPTS